MGRLNADDLTFISKYEVPVVFREARSMLAIYCPILLLCLTTGSDAPMWFWVIPLLFGEPVMRFIWSLSPRDGPALTIRRKTSEHL
jgi:hypothetical protein